MDALIDQLPSCWDHYWTPSVVRLTIGHAPKAVPVVIGICVLVLIADKTPLFSYFQGLVNNTVRDWLSQKLPDVQGISTVAAELVTQYVGLKAKAIVVTVELLLTVIGWRYEEHAAGPPGPWSDWWFLGCVVVTSGAPVFLTLVKGRLDQYVLDNLQGDEAPAPTRTISNCYSVLHLVVVAWAWGVDHMQTSELYAEMNPLQYVGAMLRRFPIPLCYGSIYLLLPLTAMQYGTRKLDSMFGCHVYEHDLWPAFIEIAIYFICLVLSMSGADILMPCALRHLASVDPLMAQCLGAFIFLGCGVSLALLVRCAWRLWCAFGLLACFNPTCLPHMTFSPACGPASDKHYIEQRGLWLALVQAWKDLSNEDLDVGSVLMTLECLCDPNMSALHIGGTAKAPKGVTARGNTGRQGDHTWKGFKIYINDPAVPAEDSGLVVIKSDSPITATKNECHELEITGHIYVHFGHIITLLRSRRGLDSAVIKIDVGMLGPYETKITPDMRKALVKSICGSVGTEPTQSAGRRLAECGDEFAKNLKAAVPVAVQAAKDSEAPFARWSHQKCTKWLKALKFKPLKFTDAKDLQKLIETNHSKDSEWNRLFREWQLLGVKECLSHLVPLAMAAMNYYAKKPEDQADTPLNRTFGFNQPSERPVRQHIVPLINQIRELRRYKLGGDVLLQAVIDVFGPMIQASTRKTAEGSMPGVVLMFILRVLRADRLSRLINPTNAAQDTDAEEAEEAEAVPRLRQRDKRRDEDDEDEDEEDHVDVVSPPTTYEQFPTPSAPPPPAGLNLDAQANEEEGLDLDARSTAAPVSVIPEAQRVATKKDLIEAEQVIEDDDGDISEA